MVGHSDKFTSRNGWNQEYHNCFPFGGLEETTRMSSNYMDEDYSARPEIKQSLTGWGDNCGSESSILETDVCVWRYAPLVVHATQEEGGENVYLTGFVWNGLTGSVNCVVCRCRDTRNRYRWYAAGHERTFHPGAAVSHWAALSPSEGDVESTVWGGSTFAGAWETALQDAGTCTSYQSKRLNLTTNGWFCVSVD